MLSIYQRCFHNSNFFPQKTLLDSIARYMSTTFRKVTNCFRSNWGRDLFADIRSVINTGKRRGLSPFDAINFAINPHITLLS